MKEIKLTQNQVALVSDEDFERVNAVSWRAFLNYKTWYAATGQSRDGSLVYMHQFIFPCQKFIDHKDGNGLNNQRENLQPCSHSQNIAKGRQRTTNKTGLNGVSWHKASKKYVAQICHNYQKLHLGTFESMTDAARAYDKKASELFGQFARLNNI